MHDAVPPALTGLAVPVLAPRLTYTTAARNEGRNDPYFNLDLRVMKDIALSRGVNMLCRADVLNALDDRSFRIEPGEQAYGRLINGYADGTYRSGRQYRLGLDIHF